MGKISFMKGKLLAKALQAVEAGHIPEQVWMKAARSQQMDPTLMHQPSKKKPRNPEEPFVKAYMERNPDTEFITIDVSSPEHPARKFALRQLEVVKTLRVRGKSARGIVEAEFSLEEKLKQQSLIAARKKAIQEGKRPVTVKKSMLEQVQEQELKYQLNGLRKMRKQYEAAGAPCTTSFEEMYPEARRWDEPDQGGVWGDVGPLEFGDKRF